MSERERCFSVEELNLLQPTEEYLEQINAYRQEFADCLDWMHGSGGLREIENARDWLEFRKNSPEGDAVSTQYLYIRRSDKKMVGMINVRHRHTEPLSSFGGHIGYSVCPSERRKGYATAMLGTVLPHCRELGLEKVLLTCGPENQGSLKAILTNGGEFESMVFSQKHQIYVGRYWIKL